MIDVHRKEFKYLVNIIEMTRLKGLLAQVMDKDEHNEKNGYCVRSLYFDTVFDSDFEDKVDGYDKRQKIRLRIYGNDSSIIKLELKEKESNLQRKRSLILSKEEAEKMIKVDYNFLMERPEKIAHSIYTKMVTRCYRPKCIVEYDRLAYLRKYNDTRVTFDMNLRATEADFNLFNENMVLYPVCNPGEITMEVKFNGFLFSYIKQAVSTADKTQVSNSKYCKARRISKQGRI